MNDMFFTLLQCATVTVFLALYDYHFSRHAGNMQFQWWTQFVPLIQPALRASWQTLAVVIAFVSIVLIVAKL